MISRTVLHNPNFCATNALTAAGLALPPTAFKTCPVNQPASFALTLATANVNIDMISTSEIKISVVIDLAKGEQAMKAVHDAFLS